MESPQVVIDSCNTVFTVISKTDKVLSHIKCEGITSYIAHKARISFVLPIINLYKINPIAHGLFIPTEHYHQYKGKILFLPKFV